jgi:hypothetical protein
LNNYGSKPSNTLSESLNPYSFPTANIRVTETLITIVLLVISQLLIPSMARFVMKFWPHLRERSVRMSLMAGWYAVMASLILEGKGADGRGLGEGIQQGHVWSGGGDVELGDWWIERDDVRERETTCGTYCCLI